MLSGLQAFLPHVEYDGFLAGDLNCLPLTMGQDGPGEWGHLGNRTARGIGLVLTHDPETLLAAVIPARRDGHAKRCLAFVSRRFDDFRARPPRPPVTDFPQNGCGGLLVALVGCGPVRRLETAESGLELGLGHETAVARYRLREVRPSRVRLP
jgi:hypothetical protein